MFVGSVLILGEEGAEGIEEIGLLVEDGQGEKPAETSHEAEGGGSEVKEVEDVEATFVDVGLKSSEGDAFAHPCRAIDQGDAAGLQPEVKPFEEFFLAGGVKHFGGPHVLGEGQFGEAEAGLEAQLLFVHLGAPSS